MTLVDPSWRFAVLGGLCAWSWGLITEIIKSAVISNWAACWLCQQKAVQSPPSLAQPKTPDGQERADATVTAQAVPVECLSDRWNKVQRSSERKHTRTFTVPHILLCEHHRTSRVSLLFKRTTNSSGRWTTFVVVRDCCFRQFVGFKERSAFLSERIKNFSCMTRCFQDPIKVFLY